jgi:hypothetical protein
MKKWWLLALFAGGCAHGIEDETNGGSNRDSGAIDDDAAIGEDSATPSDTGVGTSSDSEAPGDSTATDTSTTTVDTGTATVDTGTAIKDTGTVVTDTSTGGPITGGPCVSGTAGATAFRVSFYNGGGKPTVSYDKWGLPDKARQKVSVYGYTIPYTVPGWADPFLGEGGLQLDSSNFIDIELSTSGLSSVKSVTLSLYGRSYSTGTSGSFTWQTSKGTGATPSGSMSNAAPYKWWPGTVVGAIVAGDAGILLRIKAGGPSGSVVVNKIELCMEAS